MNTTSNTRASTRKSAKTDMARRHRTGRAAAPLPGNGAESSHAAPTGWLERLLQGPSSEHRSIWAALGRRLAARIAESDAESERRLLAADSKRIAAQTANVAARRQLMEAAFEGRVSAAENQVRLCRAQQRAHISRLPAALSHEESGELLARWLGILERQRDLAAMDAQWRALESGNGSTVPAASAPAPPLLLPNDALVAARTADDLRETAEFHYARLVRASPERRQGELYRVVYDLQAAGYTPNEIAFIQSAIADKLRRYG